MTDKPRTTHHRQLISSIEARHLKHRTKAQKIADHLTNYLGTPIFLFINISIFIIWFIVNSGIHPNLPVFDPYPFVLLITFVSLEAIILSSIVLIAQNRQSQVASLREEIALQVELISEREVTKVLRLLIKLMEKNNIKVSDEEISEMLEDVDTSYLERRLQDQLTNS